MINRINLILRAKNITARQFAEEIGIQPSGMSHIMSGRNNPSLDFVTKVIRRYPEIDANWLIMGRGAMYGGAAATDPVAPVEQPTMPEPVREATLFEDVPEPVADEEPQTREEEITEQAPQPAFTMSQSAVPQVPEPTVERMMLIYSDGTYKVYTPRG
ncbi:MAG: helix-turn-helix transcriptional regulator [Bacteroidales bacterium]|nr:helix-turn-helix transcriptional regulator [Bacteroidales bacterium]